MFSFERKFSILTRFFNRLAMIALTAMMLLTSADVIMRCFRRPIPGTYEIVGLLGALFVSFSLAHTSMERGHIAVDFIFDRLPRKARRVLDALNTLICAVLFGGITWYTVLYAEDLKEFGEVSMTLQIPLHPFVYGIALGCGLLCLTLIVRTIGSYLNSNSKKG